MFARSTGYATLIAATFTAGASAQSAASNEVPNPYRTVEGWAKLPDGRTWGSTSAVDIDKDGVSIWVVTRASRSATRNHLTH